jgi:hypothetical protein
MAEVICGSRGFERLEEWMGQELPVVSWKLIIYNRAC